MSSAVSVALSDSFEEVLGAVQETARGRWFLEEFAKRRAQLESKSILDAISKLEQSLPNAARAEKYFAADKAIFEDKPAVHVVKITKASEAAVPETKPVIAAVTTPAPVETPAPQPKPVAATPAPVPAATPAAIQDNDGMPRGAKLTIHRTPTAEPASDKVMEKKTEIPAENPVKSRIMITRRKAEEIVNVPLIDDVKTDTAA